jgi:hypothetical protein
MEGLALGPQLPGGNWALVGVVDNSSGGEPFSGNTLASFELAPSIAGDFNGDARVDGADYILWRKEFGSVFTPSDYDTWRSHFGQSAGTASRLGSPDTIAVPEPLSILLPFGQFWIFSSNSRRRLQPA